MDIGSGIMIVHRQRLQPNSKLNEYYDKLTRQTRLFIIITPCEHYKTAHSGTTDIES